MKKIKLIITSFLLTTLLFGQSSSTRSSISVSQHENSYELEADLSEGINEEVKDAIIAFLGIENAVETRKGLQWEKYLGDDLAYRFNLGKRRCEILLEERYLDQVEYEDLIDLCTEIKVLLGDKKPSKPKACESKKESASNISIKGDFSFDFSGNPVEMKINDEVFSMNAGYKNQTRKEVEQKIESVLGKPDSKNTTSSEWSKKENGQLLYDFSVKNRACEIFIDKTKFSQKESAKLQNLGLTIVGEIF